MKNHSVYVNSYIEVMVKNASLLVWSRSKLFRPHSKNKLFVLGSKLFFTIGKRMKEVLILSMQLIYSNDN